MKHETLHTSDSLGASDSLDTSDTLGIPATSKGDTYLSEEDKQRSEEVTCRLDEQQRICDCVGYKQIPRSDELQRALTNRLNRAIGQLNGVKGMIEENRYCGDVLLQLVAAESAIKAISRLVMKNHLETCVVEHIQRGDDQIIDEVMELFKKFM